MAAAGDAPVTVEQGNDLPLEAVLAPEKSAVDAPDSLRDWADGRAQSISADNAIAADIQDPATMNSAYAPMDAFTYFPLLGYPSPAQTTGGVYGGVSPYPSSLYGTGLYQPGFYSLYLPGYTYRPLLLGAFARCRPFALYAAPARQRSRDRPDGTSLSGDPPDYPAADIPAGGACDWA